MRTKKSMLLSILTCAVFGVGGIGQSHAAAGVQPGSVYDDQYDDVLLYQDSDQVALHADRIAQAVAATKPAFFDLLVFHLYREQDLDRFEQLINAAQEKVQKLRAIHDDIKKTMAAKASVSTPVATPPPPIVTPTMSMPTPTPTPQVAPMPMPAPAPTPEVVATPTPLPQVPPAPPGPTEQGIMQPTLVPPTPEPSAAITMTAVGAMQPIVPAQQATAPADMNMMQQAAPMNAPSAPVVTMDMPTQ